jgi:MFS-type transporter involved in bile tolerance (Atg22 family)
MSPKLPASTGRKQYLLNMTLAIVAGQVGCLTLLIVLASIFAGLWLDNRFQTRPIITLILVLVSIPVSLVVMFWVARSAVGSLQKQVEEPLTARQKEEVHFGEDT